MHLPPVIFFSATVAIFVFQPVTVVGDVASSDLQWRPISASDTNRGPAAPDVHSLELRRQPDVDNGLHPEIRSIRAANKVTEKFRRRGIEGPSVDTDMIIRQLEQSLERRGLLQKRQSPGIIAVESGRATAASRVIPAEMPKSPNSIGIGQDGTDVSYFSEVMFGSENKTFTLAIDTGSSDIWVPSDKCKSKACRIHTSYGSGDSTTLKTTQKNFDIKYGSGDVVGTVVTDTVRFAGFELSLSFGVATEVSNDFVNFPIDGILGLGFGDGSRQGVPTIMDELVNNGLIKSKLFGIALSRHGDRVNDGVINFGGIDSGLFEGDLSFTPSVSDQGLWELRVDNASVDGSTLGFSGKTAVIDSGTSLLLVPPQDALSIHSMISGAEVSGETFAVPCNTHSTVEFTFSGVTYRVQPIDYVGTPINLDNMCLSLIISRQILGKNTWILGDIFLKNVYSVFDLQNNRIGFAPRKKRTEDSSTSTAKLTATTTTSTSTTIHSLLSPTTTSASKSSSSTNAHTIGNASPFGDASASPPLFLYRPLPIILTPSWILVIAILL